MQPTLQMPAGGNRTIRYATSPHGVAAAREWLNENWFIVLPCLILGAVVCMMVGGLVYDVVHPPLPGVFPDSCGC